MTDPVFLDVEDVLLIHEEQLPIYGGSAGLRDRGLLESAVAVPHATAGGEFAHEDLFAMAAAYAFHIAQNVTVDDPGEELYGAMIAVAERRLDKGGVAALFRRLAGAP